VGSKCLATCSLRTCGSVDDLRTPIMIEQGCCPLNPETGLPF